MMNERIRAIYNQCFVELNNDTPNIGFDFEKFAELIVDECCLKLLNMDEKTKGSHNYYKHAALEIKKHFGVKENITKGETE